jgi:hypothetical protein
MSLINILNNRKHGLTMSDDCELPLFAHSGRICSSPGFMKNILPEHHLLRNASTALENRSG